MYDGEISIHWEHLPVYVPEVVFDKVWYPTLVYCMAHLELDTISINLRKSTTVTAATRERPLLLTMIYPKANRCNGVYAFIENGCMPVEWWHRHLLARSYRAGDTAPKPKHDNSFGGMKWER